MKNLSIAKEPVRVLVETGTSPLSVTVRRIDETHGNPLKLWEEMGCPENLSQHEIRTLYEESNVKEESWPFKMQDGNIILDASLGVNDVYFFELK